LSAAFINDDLEKRNTRLQDKERMYGQGLSLPVATDRLLILNNALASATCRDEPCPYINNLSFLCNWVSVDGKDRERVRK
jgi:hypothetical protein